MPNSTDKNPDFADKKSVLSVKSVVIFCFSSKTLKLLSKMCQWQSSLVNTEDTLLVFFLELEHRCASSETDGGGEVNFRGGVPQW